MLDNQKRDFQTLMVSTMEIYQKTISANALRIWWSALAEYDFESVRRAFSAHVTGKRGQFPPLPADILNQIRGECGHLTADEAWPLVLESMDESLTVVWTPEIAEAAAPARTCLADGGDKYAARKAFEAAYDRILRTAPAVPKWTVSLGNDKSHRIVALKAGHEAGRLTDTQVRHLLPPKKAEGNVVALLAGKTESLDSRWQELAEKLRCQQEERDSQADAERQRQIKDFNARRQAMLDSLEARNG